MIYLIYSFVVLALILIDQFSKELIVNYLEIGEQITLIKDFFSITYVRNFGAGFSILQNGRIVFLIITPLCLILFIYLLFKANKNHKWLITALLLMIGGTLGNFIDRLLNGYVVDFLDFLIFGYDFPVFNVADICLTIGVGIYIIYTIFEEKNAKN